MQMVGWRARHTPHLQLVKFAHHFRIEPDQPLLASSAVVKAVTDKMYTDGLEVVLSFDSAVEEVNLRIGTSFISQDQARINLEREIPQGKTYAEVRDEGWAAWNDLLGRTRLLDAGNRSADQESC